MKRFWKTRAAQAAKQAEAPGQKDAGSRSAVTGGRQMDGFAELARELLLESGIPEASIHLQGQRELPGYFRAEKQWDLVAVVDGQAVAVIELKSQVGPSFGNNCNNRAEESVGSATDLWAAYREGAFRPSQRPWLGFLMLLEDAAGSTSPVSVKEPHYNVFEEFHGASYAKRYEVLLLKLLRERLYDGGCFLMSSANQGRNGGFGEPCDELTFSRFAASLMAHASAFARTSGL